uniref:Uncharacterized protein n=1 Tax=Octopus bimaculoides TaxID=37653 RepID=A0A0L8HL86_OCTBM
MDVEDWNVDNSLSERVMPFQYYILPKPTSCHISDAISATQNEATTDSAPSNLKNWRIDFLPKMIIIYLVIWL